MHLVQCIHIQSFKRIHSVYNFQDDNNPSIILSFLLNSISAWIFDETQSYELAFFVSGGMFALAACLSILLTVIQASWMDAYNRKQIVDMKGPSQSLVGDMNMDKETFL